MGITSKIDDLESRIVPCMARTAVKLSIFLFMLCCGIAGTAELSDADIRELLIRQSITTYPGSCPCPYASDREGRRCRTRSAYSKPGGRAPLCYPDDVTNQIDWRVSSEELELILSN
jgi:hypothetical protein